MAKKLKNEKHPSSTHMHGVDIRNCRQWRRGLARRKKKITLLSPSPSLLFSLKYRMLFNGILLNYHVLSFFLPFWTVFFFFSFSSFVYSHWVRLCAVCARVELKLNIITYTILFRFRFATFTFPFAHSLTTSARQSRTSQNITTATLALTFLLNI